MTNATLKITANTALENPWIVWAKDTTSAQISKTIDPRTAEKQKNQLKAQSELIAKVVAMLQTDPLDTQKLANHFKQIFKLHGKIWNEEAKKKMMEKFSNSLSEMDQNKLDSLIGALSKKLNSNQIAELKKPIEELKTKKTHIIRQTWNSASGKVAIVLLALNMFLTSCDPYRNVWVDTQTESHTTTDKKADRTENAISLFQTSADINSKDPNTWSFVITNEQYASFLEAKKQATAAAFSLASWSDFEWLWFKDSNDSKRVLKVEYKSPNPNDKKILCDLELTNTHTAMIATALIDDLYKLTQTNAARVSDLYRQWNYIRKQQSFLWFDRLNHDDYLFNYSKYESARNTYCNNTAKYKNLDQQGRQEKFVEFVGTIVNATIAQLFQATHTANAHTNNVPQTPSYDNSSDTSR